MANEDEIKKLAYKIWEEAGKPEGKDIEHYFRAAKILEEQETTNPILLGASPRPPEISPAPGPQKRGVKPKTRQSRPKTR
jgi:hypothetical protein